MGEVDHRQYRGLLGAAQFVVVPTHDFGYPTGQSVLLEAMASGSPVIATATAAMGDYLGPGTAQYGVGDHDGLAERMSELWADPSRCRAMGAQARAVAERRFSTEHMWSQALPAIQSAAARGSVAA
jgi:glycosyltransferase involved in cell wall biosynthesis